LGGGGGPLCGPFLRGWSNGGGPQLLRLYIAEKDTDFLFVEGSVVPGQMEGKTKGKGGGRPLFRGGATIRFRKRKQPNKRDNV